MGDSRRFELFGALVARNLRPEMAIADVASGKGQLRANLFQRGFKNITCWDKRKGKAKAPWYRYQYFDYQNAPEYDAVIGMHPDEGTDHIIMYAGIRRVPAILCPCCIKPSASTYWGDGSYGNWIKHLKQLASSLKLDVLHTTIQMAGRNDVLILKPLQ